MGTEQGFIKLFRSILDSEIMEKPPHFREVWLYLLLRANHAEREVSGRKIERGQLITDYKEIIRALSWKGGKPPREYTENNIQSALRYLRDSGMINKTKSAKKILVTINNYRDYQKHGKDLIHDKSTNNPQQIRDESTISPHHKQEERNKNKENTYIPDIFEFENLIDEIIEENEKWLEGVDEGARESLFAKWKNRNWKLNNGDSFDNEAHFKKALETSLKNIVKESGRALVMAADVKSIIEISGLNINK